MTRYRLRLKNGVVINETEKEKYNITQSNSECEYLMLNFEGYSMYSHGSVYHVGDVSKLNDYEIDLIPNGLFKKFDVIDIEEDKYNVVCPVTSALLAVDKDNGNILWVDTGMYCDTNIFQRQFTESEIKEKFKCYANGTFMVKNNLK